METSTEKLSDNNQIPAAPSHLNSLLNPLDQPQSGLWFAITGNLAAFLINLLLFRYTRGEWVRLMDLPAFILMITAATIFVTLLHAAPVAWRGPAAMR